MSAGKPREDHWSMLRDVNIHGYTPIGVFTPVNVFVKRGLGPDARRTLLASPAVRRLRTQDVTGLVEAVHEAYRAGSANDFPMLAMALASRLVVSEIGSFNEIDPSRQRAVALYDRPTLSFFDGALERFAELQAQHPVIRYISETGDGSAMKISDFLTRVEFHALALYREVYARLDVEYQMSVTLPAALPRITAIVLSRSDASSDFDERDRTLLNLLRPHLAQAYEHAQMRDLLAERLAVAGRILANQGSNVIVLDDPPGEATPGALVLLFRYFGRPSRFAPFPDRVSRWLDDQRLRMTHQASDGLPQPFRTLTAVRDGRRVVARFVPGGGRPDALVLTERSAGSGNTELGLLGLSPREADVLRMLSSGATNAAIGARLHIASGTVKKHLDSIYRKLGVTGRVQAVSMGLDLLPSDPREGG
jgi:DNA-binding CsgD family transcriptional regulator